MKVIKISFCTCLPLENSESKFASRTTSVLLHRTCYRYVLIVRLRYRNLGAKEVIWSGLRGGYYFRRYRVAGRLSPYFKRGNEE